MFQTLLENWEHYREREREWWESWLKLKEWCKILLSMDLWVEKIDGTDWNIGFFVEVIKNMSLLGSKKEKKYSWEYI